MRFTREALAADVPAGQIERARDFYRHRPAGRGPKNLDELRETRAAIPAPPPADPPALELVADAAGRSVPIRVFTPRSGIVRGVHLDIHGGGFYLGSAAREDLRNRERADRLNIAIVSVDYRLAPENPWPAAPDDCDTAARWLVEHTEERFGTTRTTIGGSSAGATLAVVTLLRMRDRGDIECVGATLQFGAYDLSAQTPAGRRIADEYFIEAYAGHVGDRTAPDISPIFADLRNLPPTVMIVGAKDVLLEDNIAMAGRLSASGNDVEFRIYPEAPHGFTGHLTDVAATALRGVDSWLLDRFAGP